MCDPSKKLRSYLKLKLRISDGAEYVKNYTPFLKRVKTRTQTIYANEKVKFSLVQLNMDRVGLV